MLFTASLQISCQVTMEEHLSGHLVKDRAPTMTHGISLPSYDTTLPLSAQYALSCTFMKLLSLQSANSCLRNSMNKFVRTVWIHTLWTVQREITCTSFISKAQPTSAHSCSITCSKHSQITNRKSAAPINQILSYQTLHKNSAIHLATG